MSQRLEETIGYGRTENWYSIESNIDYTMSYIRFAPFWHTVLAGHRDSLDPATACYSNNGQIGFKMRSKSVRQPCSDLRALAEI